MSARAMYIRSINMQENSSIVVNNAQSVLSEFTGGTSTDVEMMIGVGLVKDSDAVFFQYMGDEAQPQALTMPVSGKPLTRLTNVTLSGLSIAEEIGEFKSTKLNIYLCSSAGRTIMLTSGLTTIWSQCLLTCIAGLLKDPQGLQTPFNLDSWKGNSKMRPCFAGIRVAGNKVSDDDMYTALAEARADRNPELTQRILRDLIDVVSAKLSTENAVDAVDVQVDPQAAELF